MCPLRDAVANASVMDDPEDGVTMDIVSKLRDRRVKMGVTTWESLWQALLPDDQCAKSEDFEPIIEIDEVKNAFERKAGKCASALQKVSSTMILMTGKTSHEEFGNILWNLASATQLERL
ncbi:ankyrin repeat protein [Colletotrichum kahawae]|uniref:Ankyrin repeat protein n=1 Tax=Colletotrichum kahawae TaxID=34407 RepID=A0AAD9YL54_COLKA|nr:ankyrin repeat protein [Colletotrichum kahawae]